MAEFQRMLLRAFAIRLLPGFRHLFKITTPQNCGMFNVFVLLVVSRLMCLTLCNFSDLDFDFSEVAMVRLILVKSQSISDWLLLSITPRPNSTLQFASHWVSVFRLTSPKPQNITSLLLTSLYHACFNHTDLTGRVRPPRKSHNCLICPEKCHFHSLANSHLTRESSTELSYDLSVRERLPGTNETVALNGPRLSKCYGMN
jgi:hypothetical protein